MFKSIRKEGGRYRFTYICTDKICTDKITNNSNNDGASLIECPPVRRTSPESGITMRARECLPNKVTQRAEGRATLGALRRAE